MKSVIYRIKQRAAYEMHYGVYGAPAIVPFGV
jgi:hypothetical protein